MKNFKKGQQVWIVSANLELISDDNTFVRQSSYCEGMFCTLKDANGSLIDYLRTLTFPSLREAQQYILKQKLS